MRIAISGAPGFVGRNLRVRLAELGYTDVVDVAIAGPDIRRSLSGAGIVFDVSGDVEALSQMLSLTPRDCIVAAMVPAADKIGLLRRAVDAGSRVVLCGIASVFGKWEDATGSPVARLCHAAAAGLPVNAMAPAQLLKLVYVDDVVDSLAAVLASPPRESKAIEVEPVYLVTEGEVAAVVRGFLESRISLMTSRVGVGFTRSLYATYMSCLRPSAFVYGVPCYGDSRGTFAEILKTPDCGQFSYFTAHPGATRGEHYHHTKTEKFIVLRGLAKFRFRHIETGERHEISVQGGDGRIVETVPGWAHDITNVGDDELVVMLWANEVFDRARPDTVRMEIGREKA